ncbi:uncharacterized protein YqgQ [Bacillus ectoiniformans]|uniref:YqgQ family protein n=1 Tax=Bacillus ectoiniformans TaxID=1494429 RepID=UPI001EF849D1|nr:YqgQ family protein [Bacillus ectoiniformans]MBM7650049.1 uncharacterized protein YqgQ [Bacillus ectoiniformans]
MYDVQQLLKRFGVYVYVGERQADLEQMAAELKDLYEFKLVDIKEYQTALLLIRHEIQKEKDKRQNKGEKYV